MGRGRIRECKYCGGRPHRGQGICRLCEARPKAENIKWKAIHDAKETLFGFLLQRSISARNISTAEAMLNIHDPDLHEFVNLVLDIARLKSHKRRRWKWLHENHPDILDRVKSNPNFDWLVDLASSDRAWPNDPDPFGHVDQFDSHLQLNDLNQAELQYTDDYFPLQQP